MRASRLLALARLLLLLGQAAAFEASNVLVVLEGRTPGGEHDHLLGAYALRSESVYTQVRTETKPTADAALWYVEDDGIWVAGASADVGGLAGGLMARDAAASPDLVSAPWQAWRGGEWREAPDVSCAAYSSLPTQPAAAADADTAAAEAPNPVVQEMIANRSAAHFVFLLGAAQADGSLRPRWEGSYGVTHRMWSEGRAVYEKSDVFDGGRGAAGFVLWFARGCWRVGTLLQRREADDGIVRSCGDALLPESAAAPWEVAAEGAAVWAEAPSLRCLDSVGGRAALTELEKDETRVRERVLEESSEEVHLVGPTPFGLRREYLGMYARRRGRGTDARPTYEKAARGGVPALALWYDREGASWVLGAPSRVGTADGGAVRVAHSAFVPELAAGVWSIRHPLNRSWIAAPELSCIGGAAGAAASKAEVARHAQAATDGAARIELRGESTLGVEAAYVGEYVRAGTKRASLVNGRPIYIQRGGGADAKALWHGLDNRWFFGPRGDIGHERGALRVTGQGWLPDLVGDDAVWEVFVSEEWVPSPRRLSVVPLSIDAPVASTTKSEL